MAKAVRVCANCMIEFPAVKTAILANLNNTTIGFTHGMCKRHFYQYMQELNVPREKIDTMAAQNNFPPDFKERPELVKKYSQGQFLERLKVLAGIKKF